MSFSSASFVEHAAVCRARVESALERYSEFGAGCPSRLTEAIRYSLLSGGKRLRPLLVLMATEACGGEEARALPAACAVELIHCYSLIHDDLPAMDDDDLRRGKPTNHKVFGEAFAILAGDALLTYAFELLARHLEPPAVAARCCLILAEAAGACGMVGGQADDIAAAFTVGDLETLERLHARKTGALLTASLRMGAAIGEATSEQEVALAAFGARIGLAFQIIDDLLDVEGNVAAVGKQVGKDSRQGKLTYPSLLGIEASRRRAEQLVAEAIHSLAIFGPRGHRLDALAHYVLERDR